MATLKLPILLVITENPPIRYWIKKHLEDQFFLIHASDENQVLEIVASSRLDFVILDSSLEASDPIELCKKVRKASPNDLFPILLITGRLKKTYRDTALEAGVTDFLSDQLDVEELETRIATGRQSIQVRQKVSELSSLIAAPRIETAKNYFKNRVLLHDQTMQYLASAKKEHRAVTLLIAQIDGFDQIQSNYGIGVADEILLSFSEVFNASIRQQDAVAPSSDGQFVALISNLDEMESKKIAELVQNKIKMQPVQTKKGSIQLTASFAISKVDANEISFNKTVNAANVALKKSGTKKNLIFSLDQELLG